MSCEIQPARLNHQLTHQQGTKYACMAWPKLTKYANFGPNIGIFAPFDLMTDQKNNADKLSRWFSVMLVPKLLLTPIKIRIFGPKTAKIGPKSAFLVILGQISVFCPFGLMADQKATQQGFSVIWVPKFLLNPV